MHGTDPRYSEVLDLMNIIEKPERKIYLDITSTRHKMNVEQTLSDEYPIILAPHDNLTTIYFRARKTALIAWQIK